MKALILNVGVFQAGWLLCVLAGGWAMLLPLMMGFSLRFDGISARPTATGIAGWDARV